MNLCFDIETAPLEEAVNYLEPAEPPANYKDPAKIAAYVAEKNAESLSKCGLDVDLCRIVAIGWIDEQEGRPLALCGDKGSEIELLTAFWGVASTKHLVGFNCLGFDLPVLLRRSLYLGVKTPEIQIDRFKHPHVSDLMQILSFNGALRFRGLAFYCKRFGIDVADELTGADIALAVAEGRWGDVERHVRADVERTAQLASRLGLFAPVGAGAF